jgi:hypothetical protein
MKAKLTPEVLELWARLQLLQRNPRARERWEPRGRRGEYLAAEKDLCRRLGLWWGDAGTPLSVDRVEPPDYMRAGNPYQADRWREAWAWRCALNAAAAR